MVVFCNLTFIVQTLFIWGEICEKLKKGEGEGFFCKKEG